MRIIALVVVPENEWVVGIMAPSKRERDARFVCPDVIELAQPKKIGNGTMKKTKKNSRHDQ